MSFSHQSVSTYHHPSGYFGFTATWDRSPPVSDVLPVKQDTVSALWALGRIKGLPNIAVYNAHFFAQILKKILFIYILERGREREREGEKHQCVCPFVCLEYGTWPATQGCALTGN